MFSVGVRGKAGERRGMGRNWYWEGSVDELSVGKDVKEGGGGVRGEKLL